eukprot:COSAG02_NODE_1647_length_11517_cov_2.751533_1_plen_46_part_00
MESNLNKIELPLYDLLRVWILLWKPERVRCTRWHESQIALGISKN